MPVAAPFRAVKEPTGFAYGLDVGWKRANSWGWFQVLEWVKGRLRYRNLCRSRLGEEKQKQTTRAQFWTH